MEWGGSNIRPEATGERARDPRPSCLPAACLLPDNLPTCSALNHAICHTHNVCAGYGAVYYGLEILADQGEDIKVRDAASVGGHVH